MSFVCSIPLIASLFSAVRGPAPLAVGYVEGEYVLLAPIEVAERRDRIGAARRPRQGRRRDRHAGKRRRDDRGGAGRSRARPGRGAARRSAGSAGGPRRSPCSRRRSISAQAQKEEAERVLTRLADLLKRGIATQADFDQAKTALDVATAMVGQARPISPSPDCRRGRDDQGRREPGQAGEGRARAGAVAAVQAHHRGAFGRPHRRHHPQPRRPRRPVGAGAVDAARRRGEAQALSAGGELCLREGRQPARRPLRRLQARADGARQLRLARPGIHAAGDLLAGDPAEAGLPGRGAAGRRGRRRCSRGRSSMSGLAGE